MNERERRERDEGEMRLFLGELDPESEPGKRLLHEHADLAQRLEDLHAVSERMDAIAGSEGEALRQVERQPGDERLVSDALARVWTRAPEVSPPQPRASSPSRPVRTRLPRLALIAAAAALLVTAALLATRPKPEQPPRQLGGASIRALEPGARVDRFGTFRWQLESPVAQASFALEIRSAADGAVLHRQEGLDQPQYTLAPERAAQLPDAITWRVQAFRPGQEDAFAQGEFTCRRQAP